MRKLICAAVAASVLVASCTSASDESAEGLGRQDTSAVGSAGSAADDDAGAAEPGPPDDETADAEPDPDETAGAASASATTTTTTEPFFPGTEDGRPFLELNLLEKIDEFLELPNTAFAANVAGEMGLSGDQRWVAWVMDIMRTGGSRNVSDTSMGALERLTGIESSGDFNTDYVRYGSWYRSHGVDPGEGYEVFKQELYAYLDFRFGDMLAQVTDRVTLGAIQFGGVRRGGIPELNNPERLTPAEADFMTDDELVLGFVIGGEAGAYPVRFLARHELANDIVGGMPVALGYCTLCLTALMFDRRLPDGSEITFQTSGLLMDSNKIMIDNETESLWNHLSGTAFAGPLAGTKLEQYPVATVRWADWLADHPDTFTLDTPPPTYFAEMPERPPIAYDYTPDAAYRSYYSSEDLWFPTFETPDVFELKEEVVTIDRNGLALALGLAELEDMGPFVYVLGGEPLVIVPNRGGARVYSAADVAEVPAAAWRHGAPVEVAPGGVLHDELRVNGVDGRNRVDLRLPRIVSSQSFWFAWYGLHPDTEIWPPVAQN
ncbi:DUF3179 domain-containing (seleno)protein [Candidatus Poriferisodalis sp.]|uniref:DUF3179 domain-containing (seleno)protein n=1 Tax=Candidatus Poriferisodalis sp. TaxID=3101277 RepID=UPI003B01E604